jgi:hypothetical protein
LREFLFHFQKSRNNLQNYFLFFLQFWEFNFCFFLGLNIYIHIVAEIPENSEKKYCRKKKKKIPKKFLKKKGEKQTSFLWLVLYILSKFGNQGQHVLICF